jgi:hypothetical protein
MGIIIFLLIALIIFEIYIRVTKQNLNELVKKAMNKKILFSILLVIVLVLIGIIVSLKTGIINSYPENVRELNNTEAIEKEKDIILKNDQIKNIVYNKLEIELDGKLYKKQIDTITEIINLETNDLSDLTHFSNLEKLTVKWSNDTNLLPIQNLTNLKYLEFDYLSNIDNIDFLKNLTNLEYLNISSDRLTNISALENLISLNELHLSGANLRDLSPLKKIMNLEILYINGIKIEDFETGN